MKGQATRLAALVASIVAAFGIGLMVLRGGEETVSVAETPGAVEDAGFEADHLSRIGLPETDRDPRGTLNATDAAAPLVLDWADLRAPEGEGIAVSFDLGAREREGMPSRADFEGESGQTITEEELAAFVSDIDQMRALQEPGGEIRPELDGLTIRMAGYVTPVGFDADRVTEFILVPFLGACIHVPPPSADQLVYVTEAEGLELDMMYEPIWVTGTLKAEPLATVLADVGYRIEGAAVEPYS